MTKKELERRNKYLLLQLKKINEFSTLRTDMSNNAENIAVLALINVNSSPNVIKNDIQIIEDNNFDYNYKYEKVNVNDYLI